MRQQPVVYKTLRVIEKRLAVPLVTACLYEAVALTFHSKRTPPLTKLAHEHKVIFAECLAILVAHVVFYDG